MLNNDPKFHTTHAELPELEQRSDKIEHYEMMEHCYLASVLNSVGYTNADKKRFLKEYLEYYTAKKQFPYQLCQPIDFLAQHQDVLQLAIEVLEPFRKDAEYNKGEYFRFRVNYLCTRERLHYSLDFYLRNVATRKYSYSYCDFHFKLDADVPIDVFAYIIKNIVLSLNKSFVYQGVSEPFLEILHYFKILLSHSQRWHNSIYNLLKQFFDRAPKSVKESLSTIFFEHFTFFHPLTGQLKEYQTLQDDYFLKKIAFEFDKTRFVPFLETVFKNFDNLAPLSLKLLPESTYYQSFFTQYESLLAEKMGLQLWNHYLKNRELFNEDCFFSFFKLALQDKSLNLEGKRKFLLENARKNKKSWFYVNEYLPMVREIYANQELSHADLKHLGIREWDWIQYNERPWDDYSVSQMQDYCESIVNILKNNNLISNDYQDFMNIDEYPAYPGSELYPPAYYTQEDIDQYFFLKYSKKSPFMTLLDVEIVGWPFSYVNTFTRHFQPLLHQIGVKDIIVGQNNEYEWLYSPGEISEVVTANCSVFVASPEIIFEFQDSVSASSNDQSRLLHYLNMILHIKGKKERFVYTGSSVDSLILIVLYDPERLNDFLNEYQQLFK